VVVLPLFVQKVLLADVPAIVNSFPIGDGLAKFGYVRFPAAILIWLLLGL
jgi:hypothetical protein